MMDIAVNLVENYLRLNGYLMLSEFEITRQRADGHFETVTDVDVMAMRFPGRAVTDDDGCQLLSIDDPALELADDMVDVIIGEVKQGAAEFNPGIRSHEALHSMLRRVEWLYDVPLADVIAAVQQYSIHVGPGNGRGTIRTRLVAFGRTDSVDLHTISHSHIVTTLIGFFDRLGEAFRPMQFREPAPALLSLLTKAGFELTRTAPPDLGKRG